LGYQGAVTVDALEGEIRFYQRRTVEAILETGKRLLVLKELAPHGDFIERVESLGFSRRTAHRFMQAAVKTSKCAKLAHLSKEVKSASAFLELVTHDDDEDLEALSQVDDIGRMSLSQVREKLRDLTAEREATQKLLDEKNRTLDHVRAKLERRENAEPDEAYKELRKDVGVKANLIEHALRQQLHPAIAALAEHDHLHGGDSKPLSAGLVMQLQQVLNDIRDEFTLPAFQNFVPSFLEGVTLPAVDPDAPLADGDVDLSTFAVEPPEGAVS